MSISIVPTGAVVKDYLDVRGITQKDLSRRIDVSERHLSKMLNGKTRLTEEMAIKLEKVMPDIPASYWLNYEIRYQENIARKKERSKLEAEDLRKIAKRFHFDFVFSGSDLPLVDQAVEMLKFLGIASFDQFQSAYPKCAVEFMQDGGEPEAVVIWLRLCENAIDDQNLNLDSVPYSPAKLLEFADTLKAISTNTDLFTSLKSCRKLLNKAGVYFVFEPAVTNSKIRGALCAHNDHPAIYISGRFKTHDHVWFTILHEIAHLILHYDQKQTLISMEELASEENKDCEANEYARNFFIDKEAYDQFVDSRDYSEKNILKFSKKHGITPGLLVGFLQHDSLLDYSKLNHLKS